MSRHDGRTADGAGGHDVWPPDGYDHTGGQGDPAGPPRQDGPRGSSHRRPRGMTSTAPGSGAPVGPPWDQPGWEGPGPRTAPPGPILGATHPSGPLPPLPPGDGYVVGGYPGEGHPSGGYVVGGYPGEGHPSGGYPVGGFPGRDHPGRRRAPDGAFPAAGGAPGGAGAGGHPGYPGGTGYRAPGRYRDGGGYSVDVRPRDEHPVRGYLGDGHRGDVHGDGYHRDDYPADDNPADDYLDDDYLDDDYLDDEHAGVAYPGEAYQDGYPGDGYPGDSYPGDSYPGDSYPGRDRDGYPQGRAATGPRRPGAGRDRREYAGEGGWDSGADDDPGEADDDYEADDYEDDGFLPGMAAAGGSGSRSSASRGSASRGSASRGSASRGSASRGRGGSGAPEGRPRRRGMRRVAPWLALSVILLLIGGVGGVGYYYWNNYLHPPDYSGAGTGWVVVQIKPGDTATAVGVRLQELGVVKSARAFANAAKASPRGNSLEAGYYRVHKHMRASLAFAMLLKPSSLAVNQIVIPEGWRLSAIISTLGAKTGKTAGYQQAVKDTSALGLPSYADGNPQGFLFPATYPVEPGTPPLQLLQAMVRRFNQEAASARLATYAARDQVSQRDVIIIASLIQAEGMRPQDLPKIARVIYNRLNANMPLQLDSTVRFAMNSYVAHLNAADLKFKSPYNTYQHTGLPPGPIDSPGAAAIGAALHPAQGNWLYFLTVNYKTGLTRFTNSYSQMLQFEQLAQQGG